jgi:hypothetical protein
MNAAVTALIEELDAETQRIWTTEPREVRAMRLGVFTSGAGSYAQYFSNMVFVNGDMRALSSWITPGVVMNAIGDETFSLEQCKSVFRWVNLINVDFLAYCGFTRFGTFVHQVIERFELIETKDELLELVKAWYAYANRMYLWVHQAFPWGLGAAFPLAKADDADFIREELDSAEVRDYFAAYGQGLTAYASSAQPETTR